PGCSGRLAYGRDSSMGLDGAHGIDLATGDHLPSQLSRLRAGRPCRCGVDCPRHRGAANAMTGLTKSFSANLTSSVPAELADELLKKLTYVSEALVDYELAPGKRDSVTFRLKEGHEHQAPTVADRIVEVASKLSKTRVPPSAKVLVSRSDRPIAFSADPHPELEASGELHRYGSGRYGFGPRLTRLMNLFDRDAQRLAAKMPAAPHQFPSMIGADTLDRCRYLRTFPSA